MKFHVDRQLPWFLGFFMMVNMYMLPMLTSSPRVTDVMALALAFLVFVRLVFGRQNPVDLAAAAFFSLAPLLWLLFSTLEARFETAVLAIRWLLAIPWGLAMAQLLKTEKAQVSFARGILVGGIVNVAVIMLQSVGLEAPLKLVGLSSAGANYYTWVSNTLRYPGLHGHHNASCSVISLMIPAGLFLYYGKRLRLIQLVGILVGLMISLHLTNTRSPMVVSLLTLGWGALLARRLRRSLLIGLTLAALLTPLLILYGPPGGWARWRNTEALASNTTERTDSVMGSLFLVMENPLGLGVKKGQAELSGKTGIGATHNAFLQAALNYSLPFGILVTLAVVGMTLKGLYGLSSNHYLPGLLAFQTAGLFMFEEHLNNPTFMILTAWLALLIWHPTLIWRKSADDAPTGNPS